MNAPRYPQRRSPRLRGYDYSQEGAYFVTICTYRRDHHFVVVTNVDTLLNDIGTIAAEHWSTIPTVFPQIECDAFVIMPNHVHGIIVINEPHAASNKRHTLGVVIGNYKAAVTRQMNRKLGIRAPRLWQDSFHDHIIRDERSLNHIRQYVLTNPAQWEADSLYTPRKT
jgi:putative transposase